MRGHELAVGWIHLALSLTLMALVGGLWWAAAGLASVVKGTWIPQLIGMFGKPIAIAVILIALIDLVAAIGMLRGQTWARPMLIGISVLELPIFPFGTAVALYTLWTLLK
jgi:hypothetical protein